MRSRRACLNTLLLLAFLFFTLPRAGRAAIESLNGNEPTMDQGWPQGAVAVANLSSRLGLLKGPSFDEGEYCFTYQSRDTAQFNAALQKFGVIQSPRPSRRSQGSFTGEAWWDTDEKPLLLVLHDRSNAPFPASWMYYSRDKKTYPRVDWTFTVWNPRAFHALFSTMKPSRPSLAKFPNYRQPVPPPRIDLYLGGDCPIAWEQVKTPPNVRVLDLRPQLKPGAATPALTIRGAVFDMATHQPIEGAQVFLVDTYNPGKGSISGATDARGGFALTKTTTETREIHIMAPGYADRKVGSVGREWNSSQALTIFLAPAVSLLRGWVKDAQGKPVAGARVVAREMIGLDGLGYEVPARLSAKTDEDGWFLMEYLPEGYAMLSCEFSGMIQKGATMEYHPVTAMRTREMRDVQIVMNRQGCIQGQVIGPDGKPPTRPFLASLDSPEEEVQSPLWGGVVPTDKDGRFKFPGVPPGKYSLTVKPNPMREGEATPPQLVTVRDGETVEVKITSEAAR